MAPGNNLSKESLKSSDQTRFLVETFNLKDQPKWSNGFRRVDGGSPVQSLHSEQCGVINVQSLKLSKCFNFKTFKRFSCADLKSELNSFAICESQRLG